MGSFGCVDMTCRLVGRLSELWSRWLGAGPTCVICATGYDFVVWLVGCERAVHEPPLRRVPLRFAKGTGCFRIIAASIGF